MVGIVSDIGQIVVFASHSDAFLRVHHAALRHGSALGKKNALELIHATVHEVRSGVFRRDDRRGRNDLMRNGRVPSEVIEECLANEGRRPFQRWLRRMATLRHEEESPKHREGQ